MGWLGGDGLLGLLVLQPACAELHKNGSELECRGGPVMALTCNVWTWWISLDEGERQQQLEDARSDESTPSGVQTAAVVGVPPILPVALALDLAALPITIPVGLWTSDD